MQRSPMKRTPANVMPPALRAEINADPEYTRCGLTLPHTCAGRITREHAIINAGRKIQAKWAIPPLCAAAHGVDQYQDAGTEVPKDQREWMAYNRATDEELMAYTKSNYIRERDRLNKKYGPYVPPPIPEAGAIQYQTVHVRLPNKPVTPIDEFEREVRAFAKTNGCGIDEARAFLQTLV